MVSTVITVIDGNVGIGTDRPGNTFGLDVHGDTSFGELVCDEFSGGAIGSNAFVPRGMIAIWHGTTTNIPPGWAICDGTNGTLDLRSRYVLGAGTSYTVGQNNTNNVISYSAPNIPNHDHTASIPSSPTFPTEYQSGFHGHSTDTDFPHTHASDTIGHTHNYETYNQNHTHDTGGGGDHGHKLNSNGQHEHRLHIVDTRLLGWQYYQASGSWTSHWNITDLNINAVRNVISNNHNHNTNNSDSTHRHNSNTDYHQHGINTTANHRHSVSQSGAHSDHPVGNYNHTHTFTVQNSGNANSVTKEIVYPTYRVIFIMKL